MHRLLKLVVQYPSRVLIKFSMIFDKSYGFSEIYLCNLFLRPSSGPWNKNFDIFYGILHFLLFSKGESLEYLRKMLMKIVVPYESFKK